MVDKIHVGDPAHDGPIKSMAHWPNNGQHNVFTGSSDKTAKVGFACRSTHELNCVFVFVQCWDCSTWQQTAMPVPGEVHCMTVYQNYLFIGMECEREEQPSAPGVPVGLVRAWDLQNPQTTLDLLVHPQTAPYTHTRAVTAIETGLDPTNQAFFVTGSEDATIRMWKFNNGTFQCQGAFEGHVRAVSSLQLIKDAAGVVALPV